MEETETEYYLIWSKKHGCFWRKNYSGYVANPDSAGRYTKEQAYSRFKVGENDREKVYLYNSRFVKNKRKDYVKGHIRSIKNHAGELTGEQFADALPEIMKHNLEIHTKYCVDVITDAD